MAVRYIKNGNKHSPPQLDVGVVKVVVVGEPGVGKSTFIRAYYQAHEPGEIYAVNGVRVYPCEFQIDGMHKRAEIFEIPGDSAFFKEQRTPHYLDAKVIVMMYGIDYPPSLELLSARWFPEAQNPIDLNGIPVVLVGNKRDLRHNQQVIEALALNEEEPVTIDQGIEVYQYDEIKGFGEVSSLNVEEVNKTFGLIFDLAVQ